MTKTRSYTYLLPGLVDETSVSKEQLNNLWLGIENVNSTFDGNVYCEYGDCNIEINKSDSYYITNYIIDNKFFVCYKYPDIIIYENFVNSYYSRLPDVYKKRILDYHKLSFSSQQALILYKTKILKEKIEKDLGVKLDLSVELGEEIQFEKECYKLKNKT